MCYGGGSKVAGAGYGATGIVGAKAITVAVPELMRLMRNTRNICGAPRLLGLPIGWPMLGDW
jgi:hypothetical protein